MNGNQAVLFLLVERMNGKQTDSLCNAEIVPIWTHHYFGELEMCFKKVFKKKKKKLSRSFIQWLLILNPKKKTNFRCYFPLHFNWISLNLILMTFCLHWYDSLYGNSLQLSECISENVWTDAKCGGYGTKKKNVNFKYSNFIKLTRRNIFRLDLIQSFIHCILNFFFSPLTVYYQQISGKKSLVAT